MLNEIEKQRQAPRSAVRPDQAWARLEALERENSQLRQALASRIVIEQAKGVLAERFGLDPGRAFELLRSSARSERRRIHELAEEVVGSRRSPAGIEPLAAEIGARDERSQASDG